MYCPKCGDVLTETPEGIVCQKGNMQLSAHLSNQLEECYVKGARKPRDFRFGFQVGGTWFCPGCGVQIVEQEGTLSCPKCRRSINEFVRELVELHSHR